VRCAVGRARALKISVNSNPAGLDRDGDDGNAFNNEKFAGNVKHAHPAAPLGRGTGLRTDRRLSRLRASRYTTGRDFVIDGGYTLF